MDNTCQISPSGGAGKRLLLACCFYLVFLGGQESLEAAEQPPYSVAVIPRHPAVVLAGGWQAFLKHLGTTVGHSFRLNVYESYESFETALLGGEMDLVYVNPYQATLAVDRGYIPLVKDSSHLVGILVVLQDSGINRLTDLNRKTIAFPSRGRLSHHGTFSRFSPARRRSLLPPNMPGRTPTCTERSRWDGLRPGEVR